MINTKISYIFKDFLIGILSIIMMFSLASFTKY